MAASNRTARSSVTGTSSDMRKQKAEHDTREERKGTGQKERPTSGWVWLFLLTSLVFLQEQGFFLKGTAAAGGDRYYCRRYFTDYICSE